MSTLIHSFSPTLTNEFTFGINRALQTVNPLNQEGIDRNDRVKLGLTLPQFYPAINPLNLVPNATFGGIIRTRRSSTSNSAFRSSARTTSGTIRITFRRSEAPTT